MNKLPNVVAFGLVSGMLMAGAAFAEETKAIDLPAGVALLSDYGYEFGEMNGDGWTSKYLDMMYQADADVTMGVEENAAVNEYHLRNGEENMIAVNEMLAMLRNGSFAQLMVEVNPNDEQVESLLKNFARDEEVEMESKVAEMEIAGKTFQTVTATKDGDTLLLGVNTDIDNYVVALKVKYKANTSRDKLLGGFLEYVEVPNLNGDVVASETENVNLTVADAAATEAVTE